MDDKVHVLSNNGTFLFRFNNGEFGSKWCGIWKKDTKYFDYFAFKVNGVFLSSSNSKEFDFYDSQYSTLRFVTPLGNITEETVCADGFVVVTLKPTFDSDIEFEFGVNIRNRGEGYSPDKRYSLNEGGKKVDISYSDRHAYVVYNTGVFHANEYYGVHSPGVYARSKGFSEYFDDASMQNKYVPGTIKAEVKAGEEFSIILSTKDMDNETAYKTFNNKMSQVKEYNSLISSVYSHAGPNSVFGAELLKSSIDALYSFASFTNKEIYAGFPFFNQFWLRDALFVLPSFLSINNPSFVKAVLSRIASIIDPYGLPNFIDDNQLTVPKQKDKPAKPTTARFPLHAMDVPPLFIINLYEYYKWTGDADFVKSVSEGVKTLLKVGDDAIENGLIHDRGRLTWMDTLDREYSIEIQALWAKAFDCAEELLALIGGDSTWAVSRLSGLLSGIKRYTKDGYVSDQLNSDVNSVNQLFLPFYRVSDYETTKLILENVEKNLLCEYGVTSVARSDKIFDPKGYHTGSVWPFTTTMLCGAAYEAGMMGLAEKCAAALAGNLNAQCSSRINEIYQPDGKPEGCPSQAWSVGMIPYVMDRFILGIDVDLPAHKIRIRKPDKSLKAERTLLLNRNTVKLSFSNGNITSDSDVKENGETFEIAL